MKYDQIATVLKYVSYKPGWTIEFHRFPFSDLAWVHIDAEVPDADMMDHPSSRTVRINVRAVVPDVPLSDTLTWLLRRLQRIEMHESREFFWWGGRRWDDPHKSGVGGLNEFRVTQVDQGGVHPSFSERWVVQRRCPATGEWGEFVSPPYPTWEVAYRDAWKLVLDQELRKSYKLLNASWPT